MKFYSREESDRPFKEEAERMATLKPKPKSYHEGANDERTAILAKVRRMKTDWVSPGSLIEDLETWILQRNERYRKNPGGL